MLACCCVPQEYDGDQLRQLVHALCPSIYGHELVKAGLLLSLLGLVTGACMGAWACTSSSNPPKVSRYASQSVRCAWIGHELAKAGLLLSLLG